MDTHVIVREYCTRTEGNELHLLMQQATPEYRLDPIIRPVESAADRWLVATIDGDLVGFGITQAPRRPNDADFITHVYVAPEHRRRGVGTALVKALLDESTSGFVAAYASPADAATKAFLLACGMETREPRGILLAGDRQVFLNVSYALRANHLMEREAERQREMERRAHWDKMWDWKMDWRNEQERRRNGQGKPRLLIAGQMLHYIERLAHPGTGSA